MAKTIAIARGYDKERVKEVHRLGSREAEVEANTWRTFVRTFVRADGSGAVQVIRDKVLVHYFEFEKEEEDVS